MSEQADETTPAAPLTATASEPLPEAPPARNSLARWAGPLAVLAIIAIALEPMNPNDRIVNWRR